MVCDIHCEKKAGVRNVGTMTSILRTCVLSLFLSACGSVPQEGKIEFVFLALGGSDVIGIGATPLTEGYVYLINADLQQRIPGTFLITLSYPGARIDSLKEQVRLAKHFRGEADMATLWIGANDLVHGDDPSRFQSDLRQLLRTLQSSVSTIVVIANLPDLTKIAALPNPAVTGQGVNFANAPTKFSSGANAGLYSGGFGTMNVLSGTSGVRTGTIVARLTF